MAMHEITLSKHRNANAVNFILQFIWGLEAQNDNFYYIFDGSPRNINVMDYLYRIIILSHSYNSYWAQSTLKNQYSFQSSEA